MPADDPIQQLVDGVLGDVRERVEGQLRTLVGRIRAQTEAQKNAAIETARAEAEAAANQHVAAVQAEAARRTEEALTRSKEDAKRVLAEARSEAARAIAQAKADSARAVDAAVAEARTRERQAELAGAERLLEAVRAFDHARSLSEVLHLLADKAGELAPRVAVLTVEGRRLRSWRLTGFPPAISTTGFETDLADDDLLGAAIASGQSCTTSSMPVKTPAFAHLTDGRVGFAVPLDVGGHVVAVLYADDDADDPARIVPSAWPEVVELLARHAARCLQALTGTRIVEAIAGGLEPA